MADVYLEYGGRKLTVQKGSLTWPLVGSLTAHLSLVDSDVAPSGKIALVWLGKRIEGVVLRSGVEQGRVSVLISGGRGGLWKTISAQAYDYQHAVSLPLNGILSAATELLSTRSTPSVLTSTMPGWIRREAEASALLDDLAKTNRATWQTQEDGSIFFGSHSWDAADYQETRDYEPVDFDPVNLIYDLKPQTMGVRPGQTFEGRKVWTTEWTISAKRAGVRIWVLPEGGVADDPLGLRTLIRETMRGVDLYALYPGKVVQQRQNGTLDLVLDNKKFPTLTNVRYSAPVASAKLTISGGSRVLVAFEEGDLLRPRAQLWEPGQGGKEVARVDDTVQVELYLLIAPLGLMGAPVVVGISPIQIPPAPPVTVVQKVTLTAGKITSGSPHLSLP